jgi:arginine decarboxylase
MARNRRIQSPYGVDEWGAGYFAIGPAGHLLVCPFGDHRSADLMDIVQRSAALGLTPPLLLRFPQILHTQLRRLYACFDHAIKEFEYESTYRSIYPLKVNPMRPVVQSLVRVGNPHAFGLEVGSKPELAIALAQRLPAGSWICVNGFKDPQIVQMATSASGGDPRILVIIERLCEVPLIVEEARRQGRTPMLGLRCRLYHRGSGRWEASGGETAKFGLASSELLYAVDTLKQAGLLEHLTVLHYHIGSQITSVRRIKDAVKEAARIYAKLHRRGAPLTTLNVGGGLGVDYDGSRTPSDSSVNYSLQEYANNVVYTVQEVCADEEVPVPDLISESGRALTAHHALLITNCESRESDVPLDYIPGNGSEDSPANGADEPPSQLAEMEEIAREISVKNYREYYHDAAVTRTEVITLFELGYLSLEQRARAEQHFFDVCRKSLAFAHQTGFDSDEFRVLEKAFRAKYITNFSVFRSVPDSWAIDHLFPVLPIHKLNEPPTEKGILVDLTCDSDGVIDKFVDVRDVKEGLELHGNLNGQTYLLAICLLGAYQDIIGDHHNLFGRPAEVAVTIQEDELHVEALSTGETNEQIARLAGYVPEELRRVFADRLSEHAAGPQAREAAAHYADFWAGRSYLEGNRLEADDPN